MFLFGRKCSRRWCVFQSKNREISIFQKANNQKQTITTTIETPSAPTLPSKKKATVENGEKRGQIGFKSYEETPSHNDDRCETKEVVVEVHHGDRVRNCSHCDEQFTYLHWNKQYCSTNCRVLAWEERTGKKFRKKPRLE